MQVTTRQLNGCDVVTAVGRIDGSSLNTLTEAFAALKDAERSRIVLNLRQVEYISSAGLNELMSTNTWCRKQGGELVLAEVQPRVKET